MTQALAAISLTTPLMLGGATLLALPIAAHLLNRRASRRLTFPTIRFLQQSQASQSHLFRIRRWLLLALRCAAVVLLVLAFARPLWRQDAAPAVGENEGAAVVIVMDRSASTAQRSGGLSAMQSLRATAGRTLDSLLAGTDRANVVFADAHPVTALPTLTANLAALRQELDKLEPTAQRGDMRAAIGLAGEMLATHNGPRRLVISSDLQASNWRNLVDGGTLPALPEGTQVTIIPLDAPPPANISLAGAKLSPHTPLVGQPATLRLTVHNHGHADASVPVSVSVGGKPAGVQNVQLPPRQSQEVAFMLGLPAGEQEIVAEAPDDALAADNRLHATARAGQRVPVVVVGDDPPHQPGGATYFAIRAIAPNGDARDRYTVRHLGSTDLTPAALTDAAAVVVSYTGPLSPAAIKALDDYARGGGGVLFFCGDGPVANNLLTWEKAAGAPLLPWVPQAKRDLATRGDLLYFTDGDFAAPLLREFDPQARQTLGQIPLRLSWSTGDTRPAARVLLKFSDGSPALAEHAVGTGRLLLANFAPGLNAGDLGKFGTFVALMQSALESIQPAHARTPVAYAGGSVSLASGGVASSDAAGVKVTDPRDQPVGTARLTRDRDHLIAALDRATLPGFYRLHDGDRVLATSAVNVDPQEGDLDRIDPEHLRAALSRAGAQVAVKSSTTTESAGLLELRGRPLWGWFVAAAMGLLGLEMLLTGLWRR